GSRPCATTCSRSGCRLERSVARVRAHVCLLGAAVQRAHAQRTPPKKMQTRSQPPTQTTQIVNISNDLFVAGYTSGVVALHSLSEDKRWSFVAVKTLHAAPIVKLLQINRTAQAQLSFFSVSSDGAMRTWRIKPKKLDL